VVAPELAKECLSTSMIFTSDEEVQVLNAEWRGKDKPTNVLSFPMLEREDLLDLPDDGPPEMLGDIALALKPARVRPRKRASRCRIMHRT
jgi:probable rRNA maturation factor